MIKLESRGINMTCLDYRWILWITFHKDDVNSKLLLNGRLHLKGRGDR